MIFCCPAAWLILIFTLAQLKRYKMPIGQLTLIFNKLASSLGVFLDKKLNLKVSSLPVTLPPFLSDTKDFRNCEHFIKIRKFH